MNNFCVAQMFAKQFSGLVNGIINFAIVIASLSRKVRRVNSSLVHCPVFTIAQSVN